MTKVIRLTSASQFFGICRQMGAENKAASAKDDFRAEYVDLHGNDQATRDEAWSEVIRHEKFAADLVKFALKYWPKDDIEEGVCEDAIKTFDGDHYLAAVLVALEIEKQTGETK